MRESATSIILFVPQSYTYFYKRSPYIIWFYFGKRPYMVLLLHINTYRIDPRVKHYQIRYTRSKKKKKKIFILSSLFFSSCVTELSTNIYITAIDQGET